MSEDPAQDGLNWYVYCGNNPVKFIDRNGLLINLADINGSDDIRFENLQRLTNDILDFDANTGNITYTESTENITKPVGTNLIRELIEAPNYIKIILGENTTNKTMAISIKGMANVGCLIFFDPNSQPSILTNDESTNTNKELSRPSFIGLGHELIHAVRRVRGIQIDESMRGAYGYKDKNGQSISKNESKEELETTGISYFETSYDFDGRLDSVKYVKSNSFYYTENALRREHGLGIRVRY